MNSSPLIADGVVFEDGEILSSSNNDIDQTKIRNKAFMRKMGWVVLLIIPLLAVCFGGVHAGIYLPVHALIFGVLCVALLRAPQVFSQTFSTGSFRSKVLIVLSIVAVLAVMQCVWFSFFTTPHPVLGSVSRNLNLTKSRTALMEIFVFISVYILACVYLSVSRRHIGRATKTVIFTGFGVSLIALSHWFYDTGLLFWTFAPDIEMTSSRARWPFVNPNHLAHFLLPVIFLIFSRIAVISRQIAEVFDTERRTKGFRWGNFLSSHTIRTLAFKFSFAGIMALSVLLSIAGSLSRSGWLALAIGTLLMLVIQTINARRDSPTAGRSVLNEEEWEELNRSHKRRRRRSQHSESRLLDLFTNGIRRFLKPLLVVFAAICFYIFLAGRGAELLEARLDYGLKYSKDDIRWQFYADTLPMIKDHLFFGVGLGNWSTAYPKYMDWSLSGINPVYLHSDPLNFLAEGGLILALPIACLALLVLIRTIHCLIFGRLDYERRFTLLGIFCGLVAVVVASFLDFPFRITAISYTFALLLACLSYKIDRSTRP